MDKLKMQSHDVTGLNTQKIAQLFPNCVTERLGKDGKPELSIDFKRLQAELSNEVLEAGEDRYQFMRLTLRPYGLVSQPHYCAGNCGLLALEFEAGADAVVAVEQSGYGV